MVRVSRVELLSNITSTWIFLVIWESAIIGISLLFINFSIYTIIALASDNHFHELSIMVSTSNVDYKKSWNKLVGSRC